MDKTISIILLFLLIVSTLILYVNSVYALDIDISNNPLIIRASNNTVSIISLNYPMNNKNISLTFTSSVDSSNNTVCNIVPIELAFDNYYLRNTSQLIDITLMDKYLMCNNEKSNLTISYTVCSDNLFRCNAENPSELKNKISNCTIDNVNLQNLVSQKDNALQIKTNELEDTKNQKFLFGIGGLILGIIGILAFQGKLYNVKDKSMEEFGKSTAG